MTRIRLIFLLIPLLGIPAWMWGQSEAPTIIPPSPEASAFAVYGNIPVSTYTGTPSVQIPLLDIAFRDLSYSVNLSYHGSGIQVNAEASNVGLGWVLNGTGVISRTIMGLDDFAGDVGAYPDADILGSSTPLPNLTHTLDPSWSDGDPTNHMFFSNCLTSQNVMVEGIDLCDYLADGAVYDFEPDQYNFNFAGYSGKFILNRNREAVFVTRTDIQINYDPSTEVWDVRTPDGVQYLFEEHELLVTDANIYKNYPTAWYLTKIISPISDAEITFNYDNSSQNDIRSIINFWESRTQSICGGGNTSQLNGSTAREYTRLLLTSIDFQNGEVLFSYSDRDDIQNGKKVDKIELFHRDFEGNLATTPVKGFQFNYGYFIGTLMPPSIYAQNLYTSNHDDDHLSHRLKLESVQEIGYDEQGVAMAKPSHKFFYHTLGNTQSNQLPAKVSCARDAWGYYNGETGNSTLVPQYIGPVLLSAFDVYSGQSIFQTFNANYAGANRKVDPTYAPLFSLQKIQYPTGGTSDFLFETHDYDPTNSLVNDYTPTAGSNPNSFEEGLLSFSLSKPIGIQQGQEVVQAIPFDISDGFVNSNDPIQDGKIPISLEAILFCDEGDCNSFPIAWSDQIYFEIYTDQALTNPVLSSKKDITLFQIRCANPLTSNCRVPSLNYCGIVPPGDGFSCSECDCNLRLAPGQYYLKTYVRGDASLQEFRMYMSYYYPKTVVSNSSDPDNVTPPLAGGLRIKQMIHSSGPTDPNPMVKNFFYGYEQDTDGDNNKEYYSFGRRMAKPTFENYNVHIEFINDPVGDPILTYDCVDFVRSSISTVPLGGNSVGYDKVIVVNGAGATLDFTPNGKTEFEYVNEPDIIFRHGFFENTTYMDYRLSGLPALKLESRNGLLLKQSTYAWQGSGFHTIEETSNQYDLQDLTTFQNLSNTPSLLNNNQLIMGIRADYIEGTVLSSPTNNYFFYPAVYSEWPKLLSTTKRVFDQFDANLSMSTQTNYIYGNSTGHLMPTEVTVTNNDGSVNSSTTIYPPDNSSSAPATMISKNMINRPIIEESFFNGNPISKKINHFTYDAGSDRILLDLIDIFPNGGTEMIQTDFTYDLQSNIVRIQRETNSPSSYIWAYANMSYPTARIINADPENVAYTSFEYGIEPDPNNSGKRVDGKWEINASGGWNRDGAKTGSGRFDLNAGRSIQTEVSTEGDYIVSFWSTKNLSAFSFPNQPTTTIRDGDETLGWKYYELSVNLTANAIFTIEGSGGSTWIDELRLHPIDAQMSTMCYDKDYRLHTMTDVNSQSVFYTYDGLGRLIEVRDFERNLLNVNEYHYKGQ